MNSDESPPGPRDPVSFEIAGARELRILRPARGWPAHNSVGCANQPAAA